MKFQEPPSVGPGAPLSLFSPKGSQSPRSWRLVCSPRQQSSARSSSLGHSGRGCLVGRGAAADGRGPDLRPGAESTCCHVMTPDPKATVLGAPFMWSWERRRYGHDRKPRPVAWGPEVPRGRRKVWEVCSWSRFWCYRPTGMYTPNRPQQWVVYLFPAKLWKSWLFGKICKLGPGVGWGWGACLPSKLCQSSRWDLPC